MSFKILVIGTSVLWGQGLHEEQKIHSLVKQALQSSSAQPISVHLLAHSGAIIGYKADDSEDTKQLPRVHGEVPTHYPTLLQQLAEVDSLQDQIGTADDVDVVLVEGGINDVNIMKILDPLTPMGSLKRMIEMFCHHHMKLFLERAAAKFPNATIVVTAYYPMLNERSEDEYLSELLYAIGAKPGGIIADIPIDAIANLAKRKILANCEVFYRESQLALQAAVDEVNAELDNGGKPRLFLAVPYFSPENTIFAADPFLFSINPDLSPQDDLADERCIACEQAGNSRTVVPICKRASNGHPNAKGAQAYADAILDVLRDSLPDSAKTELYSSASK